MFKILQVVLREEKLPNFQLFFQLGSNIKARVFLLKPANYEPFCMRATDTIANYFENFMSEVQNIADFILHSYSLKKLLSNRNVLWQYKNITCIKIYPNYTFGT